ncbi:MAG: hypothetical protein RLY20_379 [Verrucomicrobiota bacterium]|jgi:ribosome-associated translation inhibitor RaiA
MKTTISYRKLNAQTAWTRPVAAQLKHLQSLTPITSAEVVIEHQREDKPAFRVQIRLEVPGPRAAANATRHTRKAVALLHGTALHSAAWDNTVEAALLKATRNLEHQIVAEQLRRVMRGRSQLQLSACSSRWMGTQVGRRV